MRGPIQHDILAVGTAKLINGTASFFIRIYTLRFLEPAAYGVLSLGLNCLMLFDALVGAALDLGTMALLTGARPCDTPRIQPAEKAAIRLKLALGVLLFASFWLAGEPLGRRFLHASGGRAFFLILTAGGTLILLLRSAQLYFQARLRFRAFGGIDILHSALRVLLVCLVLFWGAPSALAILSSYGVAPAIVVAAFLTYAILVADWRNVRPRWFDGRAVLRSSAPILASAGISSLVSRLDVFLLALLSTPAQLGLYGAALTIATIPEILGAYLAPVFLPRILPACKAGTFFGFFRRFHLLVYLVAGALLALGLLAGKPLLSLILPARYALSIDLVRILLPGALAAASFFPLTLNFVLLTRPRIFILVDGLAAPLLVLSYYLFVPAYGAVAAAWITCLHRLLKAAIVQTAAYALARRSASLTLSRGTLQ